MRRQEGGKVHPFPDIRLVMKERLPDVKKKESGPHGSVDKSRLTERVCLVRVE